MRPIDIVPPKWALFYLLIGLVLHFFWLLAGWIQFSAPLLGMILLGLGFGLMTWAWLLFKSKETAVHPHEESTAFVQEGPYHFTRNPMYLGITLILTGIAFFLGTFPAFLIPLAFFLTLNVTFIPYEEEKMGEKFGKEYLNYKDRIRRWL